MTTKYLYQPNPETPGQEIDDMELSRIVVDLIQLGWSLEEIMSHITEIPNNTSLQVATNNSAPTSPEKDTEFKFPGHAEAMEEIVQNDARIFGTVEDDTWFHNSEIEQRTVSRNNLFKKSDDETPQSIAQVDSIFK